MRTAPHGLARHAQGVNLPTFAATRRDLPLLLLGIVIVVLVFRGPPVAALGDVDLRFGLTGPMASTPWHWAAAFLLIALVLLGERRGLSSMLLTRPSAADLEWALIAVGCSMAWTWLAGLWWPLQTDTGTAGLTTLGVAGVLVMIATASVTEEVVYRGYLAERSGALLRSRIVGAVLSLALFVVPHVRYFGAGWLLHHLVGALAIVAVTLVRRNLWAGMLTHACGNLPILIPTIAAA